MIKNYLSIGEFSKLTHTGIKALRFYDKLGILKPAYIDTNTGYRYYLEYQFAIVQIIQYCVKVGIPLRQLSEYMIGEQVNVDQLFRQLNNLAEEKIAALESMMLFTQTRIKGIDEDSKNMSRNYPFCEKSAKKQYALIELDDENQIDYAFEKLHIEIAKAGFLFSGRNGILIYIKDKGQTTQRYLYMGLYGASSPNSLQTISIPKQESYYMYYDRPDISKAINVFKNSGLIDLQKNDAIITESKLSSRIMGLDEHPNYRRYMYSHM